MGGRGGDCGVRVLGRGWIKHLDRPPSEGDEALLILTRTALLTGPFVTADHSLKTMPCTSSRSSFIALAYCLISSVTAFAQSDVGAAHIRVDLFNPGFLEGDSNYHSITAASDGMIYFSVNSHHPHSSVRLYRFNPADESMALVGDITQALGEDVNRQIPHGKIHTPLVEYDGYLYFATHTSQYVGTLPEMSPADGREPYEGGHFMRYNLKTGAFEDLSHLGLPNEGIITMAVDTTNRTLFGLTWPTGLLISYNLDEGLLHNWGAVQDRGEWGRFGEGWNFINRTLAIDPAGNLYGSTDTGRIWHFDASAERPVEYLEGLSLDNVPPVQEADFEIAPEPHYFWRNWRTILWNPNSESFWGLHGGSTQLFEFKPSEGTLRSVRPLRADGAGVGQRNPYRTQLGFMLGPDNTIYYLAHGPGETVDGRRDIPTSVHLLTYDIDADKLADHGTLIGPDDRRVFFAESLEMGPDGRLYAVASVETIDPERMAQVQSARGHAAPEETKDVIFEMQLVRMPPLRHSREGGNPHNSNIRIQNAK